MSSDSMKSWVGAKAIVLLAALAFLLVVVQPVSAGIGTNDENVALTKVTMGSIVPMVTETGNILVSIDGVGTNSPNGAFIQVEKPPGATVRKAYMAAASTGFRDYKISPGGILIDGVPVIWDVETSSSISSWNYWSDVTGIVQSKIDSAPAGRVDFLITEESTLMVDGEILVVIFDDPTQVNDNTVILYFGAQDVNGDSFPISFADPLDLTDPNIELDLSLGISYGWQEVPNQNTVQFSEVDVNGIRISSWAGGSDDCADNSSQNGGLLSVGGLDDSLLNPADPDAQPDGDMYYDDELYDLLPFVNQGDTQIVINTVNPSMDDNIFFASVYLQSVKGEPIVTPEFPTLLFPVMMIGGLFLVTFVGRKRE